MRHLLYLAILQAAAGSPGIVPEARAEDPPPVVGRWDRFEGAARNEGAYRDPYRDVGLDVTWTRPDGTTLRASGFHDGGPTWRFRVMPDRVGSWRYAARFSDGRPGVAGSFRCVELDRPGPIAAAPGNPIWFGYGSGRHELIRALHVGDRFFAANWPPEKRAAFLDWAAGQGYNTLSIASHYLNRDVEGRGKGWETPDLWPLDAAEYRRMEAVLDDLARRRFVVFPFAGFFGEDSDYPRDPADQELYVRYTIARLGSYGNLLFNVAGPEPNVGKVWMASEDVERLGRLIKRVDPFGHPLSVHNRTGVEPYRDSDWTTFGTVQGPKTIDRRELSRKLLEWHHPAKPLLAQETLWSGNVNHIRQIGRDYSDDDLRKNAFVIQMSAAALVFADNDGNSSTGFSNTMDPADRRQDRHDAIRRVWDFMGTVPFHRMRPRQDLVDRGFCLANEGAEYLVYLESPGEVSVRVAAGTYRVDWINARDTADVRRAGETTDGRGLRSPEGGDDWLVRLVRAGGAGGVSRVARGAYPDLAVAGSGDVHLVYVRDGRLYYKRYRAASGAWSEEQDPGVSAQRPERSDPEVVVDSKGRPHVFCGRTYAAWDGSAWVRMEPGVVRDTAMAIDAHDDVYIVKRGGHGGGLVGIVARRAGASAFVPLPDPDVANGLPRGKGSDHSYGHVFVGPADDALHVVYRHGAPTEVAYRVSSDRGLNWSGAPVSADRAEAPSGVAAGDGSVYLVTGRGHVHRRQGDSEFTWADLGRAVSAGPRDLPALASDHDGNLYVACFGGRYNVRSGGGWRGERTLPAPSGRPLGFAELAGGPGGFAYVVWEEGDSVQNDHPAGTSDILFATLAADGSVGAAE